MFQSYREIFEQRGAAYHQAMQEFPDARVREFEAIVAMADLAAGQLLLDMPSGGGYLERFIPAPVELVCVETSAEFVRSMLGTARRTVLLCDDLSRLFLPEACADRVISLAGIHHIGDKPAFYREVRRILKPGGLFAMADVRAGMPADGFLNDFVHAHNSLGHEGVFLDDQVGLQLTTAGLQVQQQQDLHYPWHFDSAESMARYCQLLFGIDRADIPGIIAGIARHLGYEGGADGCRMNWGLHFVRCRKP